MRWAALAILCACAWAQTGEQYAVMVFSSGCIKSIGKTDKTYLEVPMHDGRPDFSHGHMYNVSVDVDKKCGQYEVRRK